MFRKFFQPEKISPQESNKNDEKEIRRARAEKRKLNKSDELMMSRRSFLKAGLTLAGAAAIPIGLGKLSEHIESLSEEEFKKMGDASPTAEQIGIEKTDEEIINAALEDIARRAQEKNRLGTIFSRKDTEKNLDKKPSQTLDLTNLLSYSNGAKINLHSENIQEIIKDRWIKNYSEKGPRRPDLISAFQNMEPWLDEILECFRREKVPEKFAYLAIAESHFQIEAISPAGAVGPYQFMKATATNRICQMTVNDIIDERYDPIKSATSCAKTLKDLHSYCNDWDIALSGYNGGFIWDYFRATNRSERTYAGFVKFMETHINNSKESLKKDNHSYKVVSGDTLGKIAKRFGTSVGQIMNSNKLKNHNLSISQSLKIPLDNSSREKAFVHMVNPRGIRENLNYPAKFNAIYEIISSGQLDKLKTGRRVRFVEKRIAGKVEKVQKYKVSSGDTLWGISRKFGIPIDRIAQRNSIRGGNIRVGQYLEIDMSPENPSLKSIAQNPSQLQRISQLNPAIRNPNRPLPDNFTIRV